MKRVAICGIALESNKLAPVCDEAEVRSVFYGEGEQAARPVTSPRGLGFGRRMSQLCSWQPVGTLTCNGAASGPMDHAFYTRCVARMTAAFEEVQAAAPLDGVFIIGHGAGITTEIDDLDGPYFSAVRAAVGPNVPVLALLDLHANISPQMVAAVDVQVGYRRNPHVDVSERSEECAEILHELMQGLRPHVAWARLPIVAPPITQLTAVGQPLGDLMQHAETLLAEDADVANISILSGFAFADTQHNGMSVLVTTRTSHAHAEALALDLAARAWADRKRYVPHMWSIEQACQLACESAEHGELAPLAIADCADNPGGGGRGNTTAVVRALVECGAAGVVAGVMYDPDVAGQAHAAGEGAEIDVHFNASECVQSSEPWQVRARVLACRQGPFEQTLGQGAGRRVDLGLRCMLQIGAVRVVVASVRTQTLSCEYFEHLGIDLSTVRTFLVKSRGHFRAGFEHLCPSERIIEVDGPGLASPNLARTQWERLPRPVYPLDPDTRWEPRLMEASAKR